MKLCSILLSLFVLLPSAFGSTLSKDSTTDEKLFSISSLNKAGSQERSLQSASEVLEEGVKSLQLICALTEWTDFESNGKTTCPQHICTNVPDFTSSCCSESDLQVNEGVFAICLGAEKGLATKLGSAVLDLATNRATYCGFVEDECCDLPNHVGMFSLCLTAGSVGPPYDKLKPGLVGAVQGLQNFRNGMSDTCFNSYLGVMGKLLSLELLLEFKVSGSNAILDTAVALCEKNGDNIYSGLASFVRSALDYEWSEAFTFNAGLFYGYCNNDCFNADFYKAASQVGMSFYRGLNAALPGTKIVDLVNFFQLEKKCAHSLTQPLESEKFYIDTCDTGDTISSDLLYNSCTNFRTIEFSAEAADGEKRENKIKRSFCADNCGIDDDSVLPLSEEDFLLMAKQMYLPTQKTFDPNRACFDPDEKGIPHPLGNLCKDDIIKAEYVDTTKCYPAKMGKAFDRNEQCGTTKYTKSARKSWKALKSCKTTPKATKAPKAAKASKATKAAPK